MKKLFLIFLLAVVFLASFAMPAMSDEKDDALMVANLEISKERILRLEMQLALIQQQFQERSKELIEARKLRDDLEKLVRAIEEKKKAAKAPEGKVEPKPEVKPQKK